MCPLRGNWGRSLSQPLVDSSLVATKERPAGRGLSFALPECGGGLQSPEQLRCSALLSKKGGGTRSVTESYWPTETPKLILPATPSAGQAFSLHSL